MKIAPIAAFSTVLALMARAALAAWPSSGLPIATGPNRQQMPVGITAPGGDLLVFWSDIDVAPGTTALRAQRVTRQGTTASGWPAEGRGVVQTPGLITRPELVGDGVGGYLLAWYDYRNSGGLRGIYGARVDNQAALMPGWSASGTPICTFSGPEDGPLDQRIRICPDGSGGAFIAWTDRRNSSGVVVVNDVFAQHVLANGSLDPAWPAAGLALTTGSGFKDPYSLVADTSGGFWLVTWIAPGVTVIHHRSDGSVRRTWAAPASSSQPSGVSDGAGGIWVTWRDCRNCPFQEPWEELDDIYVMRLGEGFEWVADGIRVSRSNRMDTHPVLAATMDGAVFIAWLETGGFAPPADYFKAQRVEWNGNILPGWPFGGRAFASQDPLTGSPLIVSDGNLGAMLAFSDDTAVEEYYKGQPRGSAMTAAGEVLPAFPDTGLALCSLVSPKVFYSLVSDGLNGAYAFWEDRRESSNNTDVYAIRFNRDGAIGAPTTGVGPSIPQVPSGGIALSRPAPNPTSRTSALQLSLATATRTQVEVLDLSGRVVTTILDADLPAGPTDLHWDGSDRDGRLTPPGIYLMRARAGDLEAVQRIVRLK